MEQAEDVARKLLFQEARALDEGAWTAWTQMYLPEAVFWVPAWRNEYDTTSDPDREVSLIFHDSRRGLEERVARIESRKSITALPLPRTVHALANLEAETTGADLIDVHSVFSVYVYDPRTARGQTRYGRYEHRLIKRDAWEIARKKIILINDQVSSVLDFYSI